MDDESQDLSMSHDLIKNVAPEQWETFKHAIEMTEMADLANIADRLGSGEQESWEGYANSFADYEWYQFCEAYQHCLSRPFVLE